MHRYEPAPPAVLSAVALFLAQLAGVLATGLAAVGRRQYGYGTGGTDATWQAALGAAAVLACIFLIPVGIVFGKHPLRRVREAYVFQGIVIVVSVVSLWGGLTLWKVAIGLWAVVICVLLSAATSRAYVKRREGGLSRDRG